MTRTKLFVAAVAALGSTALRYSGAAHADPSQKPNLTTGDCPGGRGDILAVAWCSGEKFPDGSYWHNVAMTGGTFATPVFQMNCVIDDAFPKWDTSTARWMWWSSLAKPTKTLAAKPINSYRAPRG